MKGKTQVLIGLLWTITLFNSCDNDDVNSDKVEVESKTFSIAVIPDTQNMTDFTHQSSYEVSEGVSFPIDASNQFYSMMEYIAENTITRGGDIAFVTSVGDIWQHQTEVVDQEHLDRGFSHDAYSIIANSGEVFPTQETVNFEMPLAKEGYKLLAETGIPFGVAPGNHDADAMWSEASFESNPSRFEEIYTLGLIPEIVGMLHIGGHKNFNSVFGSDTEFFKNKSWYISSYNGGANSAQKFSAAGYTFINISFEMHPGDDVLAWAQTVIDENPGLPTIITTHDFLKENGLREANPIIDLAKIDSEKHNSSEEVFQNFVKPNDQVFLILSGHHHGKSMRIDDNNNGNQVIQVLADYQDRGQSVLDVAPDFRTSYGTNYGIGDGWLRLMNFNFENDIPYIEVKTYSSHYNNFSDEISSYSSWYKASENPDTTDEEFYTLDSFTISLDDFKTRFK